MPARRRRADEPGSVLLEKWVKEINAREKPGPAQPLSIHVVLVDASESFAIHVRSGCAVLEPRASGPCDVAVATSSAALHAVLSRQIRVDEALRAGLLSINGEAAARFSQLVDAIPGSGLGS